MTEPKSNHRRDQERQYTRVVHPKFGPGLAVSSESILVWFDDGHARRVLIEELKQE